VRDGVVVLAVEPGRLVVERERATYRGVVGERQREARDPAVAVQDDAVEVHGDGRLNPAAALWALVLHRCRS
jgi:hypothetical protein